MYESTRLCRGLSEPDISRFFDHHCTFDVNMISSKMYFQPTMSLSLTTINSIYLVSVWTEGLRTNLLDRFNPPDACCSFIWSGLSSSLSPPLLSHWLSSAQSGHREEQSCRQLEHFRARWKHDYLYFSQTLEFLIIKSCACNYHPVWTNWQLHHIPLSHLFCPLYLVWRFF